LIVGGSFGGLFWAIATAEFSVQGMVAFRFYLSRQENEVQFFSGSATSVIPVVSQSQNEYRHRHRHRMGGSAMTIADTGCAITCGAMIFSYYSKVKVTPENVNDWLCLTRGFIGKSHYVDFEKMLEYANTELKLRLRYIRVDGCMDNADVDKFLDGGVPVMLYVGHRHWVVATGRAVVNGKATYLISDPQYVRKKSLLSWGNKYTRMRVYYPSASWSVEESAEPTSK
jgi:hypothetical protein